MTTLRKDLNLIADLVENNSKVIDVGCGNGELINFLSKNKNAKIQGLEINQKKLISVLQKACQLFKEMLIKILGCTLIILLIMLSLVKQYKPQSSLKDSIELTRIGKKVIVSIPNFGF